MHNTIEFLAYNRGHGSTTSLGKFKGLQINMQLLNNITIAADEKSAMLQGGTYNDQVMRTLWDQGYVTSELIVLACTICVSTPHSSDH